MSHRPRLTSSASLMSNSSTSSNGNHAFRIVLLGAEGVGKSSIVSRLFRGQFSESYSPTMEEVYREKVMVDDQMINLEIIDTAGSFYFPVMRELYYRRADEFVLVYDYAVNELHL